MQYAAVADNSHRRAGLSKMICERIASEAQLPTHGQWWSLVVKGSHPKWRSTHRYQYHIVQVTPTQLPDVTPGSHQIYRTVSNSGSFKHPKGNIRKN